MVFPIGGAKGGNFATQKMCKNSDTMKLHCVLAKYFLLTELDISSQVRYETLLKHLTWLVDLRLGSIVCGAREMSYLSRFSIKSDRSCTLLGYQYWQWSHWKRLMWLYNDGGPLIATFPDVSGHKTALLCIISFTIIGLAKPPDARSLWRTW